MIGELPAIIISTVISFLLGIGIAKIVYFFQNKKPAKRLWQIIDNKDIVICTSNSANVSTGEYIRPATGIGQIQALAFVVPSLNKAYGKIDIENIYLSSDHLKSKLESDIILLGGPKNNIICERYFQSMAERQPALQVGSTIIWRKWVDGQWADDGAEEYHGEVVEGEVVSDFGLIMRTANPFTSRQRTIVALSGSHTYGTVAAAKFFTEQYYGEMKRLGILGVRNVIALVKANIIHEYPTSITLIRRYEW